MKTEDAGDYGGTCETCANGVAKVGHSQCSVCEQRQAEIEELERAIHDARQELAILKEELLEARQAHGQFGVGA